MERGSPDSRARHGDGSSALCGAGLRGNGAEGGPRLWPSFGSSRSPNLGLSLGSRHPPPPSPLLLGAGGYQAVLPSCQVAYRPDHCFQWSQDCSSFFLIKDVIFLKRLLPLLSWKKEHEL